MNEKTWIRRVVGALLVCTGVVSVSAATGTAGSVVSAAPASTVDAGGEFHPLKPARILDTRPDQGLYDVAPLGKKPIAKVATGVSATAAEFKFDPLGRGGLPANAPDVLAVVMTVTVTQADQAGYIAAYPTGFEFGGPTGTTEDVSALLNYAPGVDVPNLAVVGVGPDGTITFNANGVNAGSYHLVIDVFGWISTSQYGVSGSRLEVVTPGRILDTRSLPNPRGNAVPMSANDTLVLPIRGADAVSPARTDIVPNDPNVSAVLINLALVNNKPTALPTYVSATPVPYVPTDKRTANSLVVKGGVHANMAVVPVGPDGNIHLYNLQGELDIVVDVLGYFVNGQPATTNRGRVVPLEAPFRAFDTRTAAFGDTPLGHGSTEQWSFKNFTNSVTLNPGTSNPTTGPNQQGLIGNLVAIDLQRNYSTDGYASSFLQLYPGGQGQPLSANINFFVGEVVPNMSLLKYGDNAAKTDNKVIEAFNVYGSIDYVLDVYAIVLAD